MSIFVGIKIEDRLAQACQAAIEGLSSSPTYANLQWTLVGNLHLTLCFLGELDASQIDMCLSELKRIAKASAPLTLTAKKITFLPAMPSCLVVAVEPEAALKALFKQTSAIKKTLGVALPDRPFYPHITLARSKHNVTAKPVPWELSALANEQAVEEISLFKSSKEGGGQHLYKLVGVERLRGKIKTH